MGVVVSLKDVVDAMDLPSDDWTSYLNPKTGEIVTVTDEDHRLVEDEMERFANSQEREARRDELLDAVRGAGAFRSFRSAVRRLRIEEERFGFRQSAFERIALGWLEAHGISFR